MVSLTEIFFFPQWLFGLCFFQPAGQTAVTSRVNEPPQFVFHQPFPNVRIMLWVPIKTAASTALLLILWLIY